MDTSTRLATEPDRIDPRIVASGHGAMLYDGALRDTPTDTWFDRAWWRGQGKLRPGEGGRGGIAFLDTPVGICVLRHYRRGGMVAPLMGDHYMWRGRASTRSFAEFRVLATLWSRALPVPAPVAARYVRRGIYYRADLITRAIAGARTLTDIIESGDLDGDMAARVGALIARFHVAGVDHADLNAHNILLAAGELWLIDFDRGEIRATGTAWKLANLARFKRSLLKVGACDHDEARLDREIWAPLMRAYERAIRPGR